MKKKTVFGLVLGLTALVVVAVVPVTTASAAGARARLENLLIREQTVLADQQQRLELAVQVVEKAHEWLDGLEAQVQDTSALEAALSEYEVTTVTASQFLDTAKSALETKSGFDATGHVLNMTPALSTIKKVGRAERQFHRALTSAATAFQSAVQAYRRAN